MEWVYVASNNDKLGYVVNTILEARVPRNWAGEEDPLFVEELLASQGGLSFFELIVWLVRSLICWVGGWLGFWVVG
jgi:hypothetical protein